MRNWIQAEETKISACYQISLENMVWVCGENGLPNTEPRLVRLPYKVLGIAGSAYIETTQGLCLQVHNSIVNVELWRFLLRLLCRLSAGSSYRLITRISSPSVVSFCRVVWLPSIGWWPWIFISRLDFLSDMLVHHLHLNVSEALHLDACPRSAFLISSLNSTSQDLRSLILQPPHLSERCFCTLPSPAIWLFLSLPCQTPSRPNSGVASCWNPFLNPGGWLECPPSTSASFCPLLLRHSN